MALVELLQNIRIVKAPLLRIGKSLLPTKSAYRRGILVRIVREDGRGRRLETMIEGDWHQKEIIYGKIQLNGVRISPLPVSALNADLAAAVIANNLTIHEW